jgi:hypothetical protein
MVTLPVKSGVEHLCQRASSPASRNPAASSCSHLAPQLRWGKRMPQRAPKPRLLHGHGSTIIFVMRQYLFLMLSLAVLAAACSSPTVTRGGPGTGGTGGAGGAAGAGPCTNDTDCQSEQSYCRGFSHVCPNSYSNFTVTPGTCHRDCSFGACACVDDTDCRTWEHCSQGTCVAGNRDSGTCPPEPINCPPGCALSLATDQVCLSTCRCDVCPASDGGPG